MHEDASGGESPVMFYSLTASSFPPAQTSIHFRQRGILLNNAWCSDCHDANASFAPGYTLRADEFEIVIEGKCAKCGCAIARCSY